MLVPTGYAPDYVSRRLDFRTVRRNHDYIFNRRNLSAEETRQHLADARAAGEDCSRWIELLAIKENEQ